MDSYLRLDVKEEELFQSEIDRMGMNQKEEIIQTMTSWEEKGMEKERQTIALNLLRKKLDLETIAEVTGMTIAQLHQLQAGNPSM